MKRALLLALLLGLLAGGVHAAPQWSDAGAQSQDAEFDSLEVEVTRVDGASAWLDVGYDQGVRMGDTAWLFPLGGLAVEARISAVDSREARVELDGVSGEAGTVMIGTRGVIRVPADRGPQKPAWTHGPVEWDESEPLLAPPRALRPSEREPRLFGRLYTRLDVTRDDGSGERRYTTSRTGFDLEWTNPFGRGGALVLDGDVDYRSVETDDGTDEDDGYFRANRLSYRQGGARGEPLRFEIGRFLHSEFPELGAIDGAEVVHRVGAGGRVGASVGLLLEPQDDLEISDDPAVSLFYRHAFGEREDLRLGVAAQKTWHEGDADRDLFIGTLDWRASEDLALYASAQVDMYGSEDAIKGSGFELTRLVVNGSYRLSERSGVGVFGSHFALPELLRDEFPEVAADRIAESRTTRAGVSGWRDLSEDWRLSGRVAGWNDEDDSGGDASARIVTRAVPWDQGDAFLSLFAAEGKFTSTLGARTGASWGIGSTLLRLDYDAALYESDGTVGDDDSLLHHAVRGALDLDFGADWDLSLYLEQRFGDEQDAFSVGFFLQRRL